MKPSKTQRQSRILKIVREQNIETQSELVEALTESGMTFTQATVSRDIKELGIVKVATGDGKSKYVAMKHSGEVAAGRLMNVFSESVISVNTAGAFVILKTLPGTAQAAASALDSMHINEILGTLAGDDTIFIATDSTEIADLLRLRLVGLSTGDPRPDQAY